MTRLVLPGLPAPPEASTPAARRRHLRDIPAEVLADQVADLAIALRALDREALEALAALAGLPLGEVLAAPFGLRAVARAVAVGATTLHHELRLPVAWPGDWRADAIVADEADATWQRGVLQTGKYQSFLQDDPLATYNPAHMAKWGPHELAHRAAAFFWRADMTRWELYLGARLNELAPVVLWYGPDEVLRLDREGFDRDVDQADPEAPLERALWLRESEDDLRRRARATIGFITAGIDHFERELRAVDAELAGGRMTSVEHPFLDAASDAAAYVIGHWERLTSGPTRGLVEGLLVEGRDYHATVRGYRDRIERELDGLLFGAVAVDLEASLARIESRQLWDWLARAAQGGPELFGCVAPWLPEARAALAAAQAGERPALESWSARIREATGESELLAGGDLGWAPEVALAQLLDGFESVVPATARMIDRLGRFDDWLLGFVTSPHLRRRLPLAARVAAYVEAEEDDPVVRSLLGFELALLRATRRDDQVERLSPPVGQLPAGFEAGYLYANSGFERVDLDADVAELHALLLDDRRFQRLPQSEPTSYLVGAFFNGIAVLPLTAAIAPLWERLAAGRVAVDEARSALAALADPAPTPGWPENADEWLVELLSAGAVGWVPGLLD